MEKKKTIRYLVLALSSLSAGMINSLVGAGGGVILIFAIKWFYKDGELRNNFALANISILAFSLVSLLTYLKRGNLRLGEFYPYALPAIIGGCIGAVMLGRVKTRHLKLLFATIMFYSGVKMII